MSALEPAASRPRPFVAAALFLLAYVPYALTAYPGLAGGDSGELTAAAYSLGVPHPTGYPLYLLLARSWLWLCPIGDPAFRLNLLSAACAAGAAALLSLLHRRLGLGAAAAAGMALLFAWSPGVWSQSVAGEVYALETLLAAAFLLALARWDQEDDLAALLGAALLGGAMLAHHLTSVFVGAAGALAVLSRGRRVPWGRVGWRLVVLGALPLALYAVLVVRSRTNPPVDWGNPETIGALLSHVTGREFGSKLLPVRLPAVADNLRFVLGELRADFPLLLFVPAAAGAGLAAARGGGLGIAVASLALMQGTFCLLYRVQDLGAFCLPLILALNLGLGALLAAGARRWGARAGTRWGRIAALACGAGLLLFGAGTAMRQDQSGNDAAPAYGADLLDSLPYGAQLLSEGDYPSNALLYAQVVGQRRTDVGVFAHNGQVFQGYGGGNRGAARLYGSDRALAAELPGYQTKVHGVLYAFTAPGAAGGPDPWEIYRPLPDEADLERLGRADALAQYVLVNGLMARWARARQAGDDAAAARYADELLRQAERHMESIVPREDEFRYMADLGATFGRWDLLVRWGERLAAVAEPDAPLANNLAWAYLQLGRRLDRAEALARRAAEREPGNGSYLDTLALVLWQTGKPEEARTVMLRARAAAPDDAQILADSARVLGGQRP